jgi:alcohol dehydrogenase, propanol-preferring
MRPIVIDSGDAKEALAKRCGAEAFIDFKKESNVAAKVIEVADGVGAHGVIVTAWQTYKGTVSRQNVNYDTKIDGLADAVSYIGGRIGGVIMCIGLPPTQANVVLGTSPLMFAALKLTITGSIVGDMQDAVEALGYAQRGELQSICEVRGLSAFPESVQQLKRGEVPGRIVIDFNKE